MSDNRHARASEIFLAICDLAPEVQTKRLLEECEGAPELLELVQGMLAADREGVPSFEKPAAVVYARRPAVDPGKGLEKRGSVSNFDRAQELFEQLVQLPPEQLEARLAESKAGADVIELLRGMLAGEDHTPVALGGRAPLPACEGAANLPDRIGEYEILGVLGEGGMGVVYEARQSSPQRTVALKLLRPGLVTDEQLRRFRHEAEVLGWLNHVGIAQIYEAGTAETTAGLQPFIAMELVPGERIDRYTERAALSV